MWSVVLNWSRLWQDDCQAETLFHKGTQLCSRGLNDHNSVLLSVCPR